jgi:hypothetical protein
MNWEITKLMMCDEHMENAIACAVCNISDGKTTVAKSYTLSAPSPEEFVPLEEIDEARVVRWIKEQHPNAEQEAASEIAEKAAVQSWRPVVPSWSESRITQY